MTALAEVLREISPDSQTLHNALDDTSTFVASPTAPEALGQVPLHCQERRMVQIEQNCLPLASLSSYV
jgi:hypothetical protein